MIYFPFFCIPLVNYALTDNRPIKLSEVNVRHQPVDELIHHRPVIDGQKLLAGSRGNGVESCAGAAGEDEAFHCIVFLFLL